MDENEVSPDEMAKHVENMHGVPARFVESVPVKEMHEGAIVWDGAVQVFDLIGHPKTKRAYAWSYATEGGKRKFVAVLGLGPVDGPVMAVRASILAENKPI